MERIYYIAVLIWQERPSGHQSYCHSPFYTTTSDSNRIDCKFSSRCRCGQILPIENMIIDL